MKFLKSKKFVKRVSIVFAGTLLLSTMVNAASLTKKIDATFKNIQIFYNNQVKTTEEEPFLYKNRVYLPVRAVAELVDKNVQWVGATNSVLISDKADSPADSSSKDFEIARLKAENSKLQSDLKKLQEDKKEETQTGNLDKTLDYLEYFFGLQHSIDWDFKLTQTSSRANVEVSFDSRYDDRKWDSLTKTQREKFFQDISREIRIDLKDTPINGRVIDRNTNKEVATFSYSTRNAFTYNDHSAPSFLELERDLKKQSKKIVGINGRDIVIEDIIIKGNNDDITFTVYVDLYSNTLRNEWADTLADKPREIRQLMEYLQEEILRDYRYATVQGFVDDLKSRETLTKFDGINLY